MNKEKYTNIGELETIFTDYMVPYGVFTLHTTETGVIIMGLVDKKSNAVYLEKYNPIVESKDIYSFNSDELPLTWRVDTITPTNVEVLFRGDEVVVGGVKFE